MSSKPSTGRRAQRMLLSVGLLAALGAGCTVAVPAFATNEYYECGSCAETNGPNNYITNNQVINHSGGGICGAIWRYNGGANYTLLQAECMGGGATVTLCHGSELYGHGEAESESGNGFLRGRQDNFAYCG